MCAREENFLTPPSYIHIFFLFVQYEFWSSHRQTDGQTDRKRCILAHRAYAQACSKTGTIRHLQSSAMHAIAMLV